MLRRQLIAAAGCCALTPSLALSASFPSKPIKIIVPFPAGGGTDVLARAIGQRMSSLLGQAVIVDNKPGANGVIGADAIAKSEPDGHSLLLTIASHAIAPAIYKKLPYSTDADFVSVSLIAKYPYLFTVPASLPVNTFQEFIAYVKAHPKSLSYASSGTGSGPHLGMELLNTLTGMDLMHVPYKGAAPANNDLAAGQVHAMLNNLLAAAPMIRANRIKVLALTSAHRSKALPAVPTVAESGFPSYEVDGWYGLFAPDKTPDTVVALLADAVAKALQVPEVLTRLSGDGAIPVASSPKAFFEFFKAEKIKWAAVAQKAKVTVD
jgi:tripartite-type tricarboxylate transporter receptor subunit TctC